MAADIARLQQVLSLRQLGFSLEEIHDCLSRPAYAPLEIIRLHLGRLHEQIEAITMTETYFTPEQQEMFKTRREEAGEETLRQKQEEWAELIAKVRAEMDAGTDTTSAKVQVLAKQWVEMVRETTGGDPAVEQALKRLWDEQGDALAAQHGSQYDPGPVFGYITQAIAALKHP